MNMETKLNTLLNLIQWKFQLDELSWFFVALILIISAASLIYLLEYQQEYKGKYSIVVLFALSIFFPLSMIGVVAATNTFSFMFCWELMSISSYFLVIYDRRREESIKAGFVYLVMTHLSAAFLLAGFLMPDQYPVMILVLFILASAIKMGLVPLHFWLPAAHPAAPAHISAMMSGLMVKIPFYVLIRLLLKVNSFDLNIGYILLVAGLISALVGVLYAASEQDFKKILAYSTIENIGIALIALSLFVLFRAYHQPYLSAIALIACLLHIVNHALFKTNLFLGAGAVHKATHLRNLNDLGGLIHRMPVTSLVFLISVLAASGMPFLNGFVVEWILYNLAIKGMAIDSGMVFFIFPVILMILAMIVGIAFLVYTRLYSIAFLGYARTDQAKQAREVSWLMQLPSVVISVACIYLGINPQILEPLWAWLLAGLNVPYVDFSSYLSASFSDAYDSYEVFPASAAILCILIAVMVLLIWNFTIKTKSRSSMPWACGQTEVNPKMQYSAVSFSQPLLRLMKFFYTIPFLRFFKIVYYSFCNLCIWLRDNLHTNNLRRYLFYILLVLIGGLSYAKYF